ncbi:hypothetical protein [Pseudomonas sp. 31 R 17]|nr:hypothetical protein [Pseudomonas sp. 31 R 17]
MQHNRITADFLPKCQILQKLSYRTNTIRGSLMEDIKGRLRVDNQRGNG